MNKAPAQDTGRVATQIFDELPPAGAHGQIAAVRNADGIRRYQWDREQEAWLPEPSAVVVEIYDEADLPASGLDGQIITVRDDRGDLSQRQWDGEWKELAAMPVVLTRVQTLSIAAGDNTTAWQEIDSALGSDIYVTAVSFRSAGEPQSASNEVELYCQVATGAAGAESVILDELPVNSSGASPGSGAGASRGYWPVIPPVKVDTGTRIAVRVLDEDDGAVNWDVTDEPQITVHYYTEDDIA